jgi:hypothetical protein
MFQETTDAGTAAAGEACSTGEGAEENHVRHPSLNSSQAQASRALIIGFVLEGPNV